jgi:hypothetical protein
MAPECKLLPEAIVLSVVLYGYARLSCKELNKGFDARGRRMSFMPDIFI